MSDDAERSKRRATRDRIFDAAATLFTEHGYEDTTMAEIADRARVSRRTAFNHFDRKSEIPMLWTRRLADRSLSEATEGTSSTAIDLVRSYLRILSSMVEAEPELSRQMMTGWVAAAGPIVYESQLLDDLVPVLSRGQDSGEVRAGADVVAAARTLSDVLMGATLRWVRERDVADSLAQRVSDGAEFVLRDISPAAT